MDATHTYKYDVKEYYKSFFIQGGAGLILGILVDRTTKRIQDYTQFNKYVMILIQLFLAILILYIIERKVSDNFASVWQSTNPGLLFVSLYFGTQFVLYNNIIEVQNQLGL